MIVYINEYIYFYVVMVLFDFYLLISGDG